MTYHIVVAEDDVALCYVIERALLHAGYNVAVFDSSKRAWGAVARDAAIDLLLTDIRFQPGEPNGVALARNARFNHIGLPVIFLTGHADLIEGGETDLGLILRKPAEVDTIIATVGHALAASLRNASDAR